MKCVQEHSSPVNVTCPSTTAQVNVSNNCLEFRVHRWDGWLGYQGWLRVSWGRGKGQIRTGLGGFLVQLRQWYTHDTESNAEPLLGST